MTTIKYGSNSVTKMAVITHRFLCLVLLFGGQAFATDLPRVEVSNVRRVFHNGEHNAFTDLIRFHDKFYLTFRSCPDGHMVHSTASIIVLVSEDMNQWQQAHRFRVALRDTRDPHFLIFNDKLFVYTSTWYCGETTISLKEYDMNKNLGYTAWTSNGAQWHSPILLEGTFGHYIWRAGSFGARAYLCARRNIDFEVAPYDEQTGTAALMLESDDGLIWRKRAVFHETGGNETAFLFEPSGNIIAIGRDVGNGAEVLRAPPPYTKWNRYGLGRRVGGPLLARWGKHLVVGGRKSLDRRNPKTSMYWLVDNQLHEFAELPSGGDTSYPGFIALSPTQAIMSWYSSHEKNADGKRMTAIYVADLTTDL